MSQHKPTPVYRPDGSPLLDSDGDPVALYIHSAIRKSYTGELTFYKIFGEKPNGSQTIFWLVAAPDGQGRLFKEDWSSQGSDQWAWLLNADGEKLIIREYGAAAQVSQPPSGNDPEPG